MSSAALLLRARRAAVSIAVLLSSTTPVFAQFVPGPNPITGTVGAQTIAGGTGTANSAGAIQVSGSGNAVTLSATSGTTTINNSGTITQTGTGRTIRNNTSGTPSLVITNNVGALIRSADADTIRADVGGSNWTINNSGNITSANPSAAGSQAIDLDAVTTGVVSITNNATGQIQASFADAIRPGANVTVVNLGTITAILNSADPAPSSDGIDTQLRSGVTVTNSGAISGRHGITGGDNALSTFSITVNNNAGGTITGVNGSGVNIDGLFTTATANVTNAFGATILGTVAPGFANGDGDGVDVDGVLTLNNYGDIKGYGAKGVGSDTLPNNAQAVSIGGGTINNYATGRIIGSTLMSDAGNGDATRAGEGILSDNSSGGNAIAITTVTNDGLIWGKTGAAIRFISTFSDSVTNNATGTIQGAGTGAAIQTGNGANIVTNRGAIIGDNGIAIDLQGGNDTLNLYTGSSVAGTIDGGTGSDTVHLLGTGSGTLGSTSNIETLSVEGGNWMLVGTQNYLTTSVAAGTSLEVNDTTASFGGTFIAGALKSDPATLIFDDLNISSSGFIQASAGDLYEIGGNFLNHSTQNALWDTSRATLEFFGSGSSCHEFLLTGDDVGEDFLGFDHNFAWAR